MNNNRVSSNSVLRNHSNSKSITNSASNYFNKFKNSDTLRKVVIIIYH